MEIGQFSIQKVESLRTRRMVAVLYICTGAYVAFFERFFSSFETYFLTDCEVHYFVFTDSELPIVVQTNSRVHIVPTKAQAWPLPTLLRFETFQSVEVQLRAEFDYVFFINANFECVKPVLAEDILPRVDLGESYTFVTHPGYFNKKPDRFPYERSRRSCAYIPFGCGQIYICGGMNGGRTSAYCDLINELALRIKRDFSAGVIARWHDESHINRFLSELNPLNSRILTPSFCYPEDWNIPFEPIMLVRDKSKVIDVARYKGTSKPYNMRIVAGKLVERIEMPIRMMRDKLQKRTLHEKHS